MNSPKFYLHQIFTSSFAHDDLSHIAFNLVYFCLLGSICEKLIGKHYIRLIILTIFIDVSFWMLLDPKGGALGLSGVISSILVLLLLMRNNLPVLLNFAIKFLCITFILADITNVVMDINNNKFDDKTATSILHCVGFSAGFIFMSIYSTYYRFKASRFYPFFLMGKLKFIGGKLKSKIIQLVKRRIDKISAIFNIKNSNGKVSSFFYTVKTMKIQILILSAGILISNASHSQTKFKFSNSSIKLYESSLNKGIDELLKDENTRHSKESESIGLYEIDLLKKTLTLSYNGSEEIFLIKDYRKENDQLYITTITQDKNKDYIAYYRINLNKDATENAFIHQYYYSNIQITYGIVSDKIEFLASK
jgi:hypothetical protein